MTQINTQSTGRARLNIAVDESGTFTDGVLLDTSTNEILFPKSLTT